MSTAIVSNSPVFDFKDILYKSSNYPSKMDRKAVGSPIGYSAASARRNSGTTTTNATILTAAINSYNNKLKNSSLLCINDNNTSTTAAITNNNNLNNLINHNNNNCIQPHRKLDRSLSEPVNSVVAAGVIGLGLSGSGSNAVVTSAQQQQQQQQQQNSSRYKTELCRPFEESGTCKYGDKCQFAHGGHELRNLARHPKYKTELCRTFHTTGFCPYGPRCHFIHNADESRKSSTSSNPDSPATSPTSPPSPPSSCPVKSMSPPPLIVPSAPRPKALSVGSFSMATSSDNNNISPPSSLNDSPTNSIGSFFEDSFLGNFNGGVGSQPGTPTANNAFTYSSQDFNLNVRLNNKNSYRGGCGGNDMNARESLLKALNQLNTNHHLSGLEAILDSGVLDGGVGDYVIGCGRHSNSSGRLSPPDAVNRCSPTEDDADNLGGNISPVDISRSNTLRLPIFSQLSVCDDA